MCSICGGSWAGSQGHKWRVFEDFVLSLFLFYFGGWIGLLRHPLLIFTLSFPLLCISYNPPLLTQTQVLSEADFSFRSLNTGYVFVCASSCSCHHSEVSFLILERSEMDLLSLFSHSSCLNCRIFSPTLVLGVRSYSVLYECRIFVNQYRKSTDMGSYLRLDYVWLPNSYHQITADVDVFSRWLDRKWL